MVKSSLSIPHTILCPFSNKGQGAFGDTYPLLFHYLLKSSKNLSSGDFSKVKPLTARNDSERELMGISSSQDENDMRGRFLQSLEKSIEGFTGEHMDFIYNINFEFCLGGGKFYPLPKISHLINTSIRSPIDLQYIQRVTPDYFLAVVAAVTGIRGGSILAIQGLG
ncbi:hypothetical protein ES703_108430 [subsurface metagenome]